MCLLLGVAWLVGLGLGGALAGLGDVRVARLGLGSVLMRLVLGAWLMTRGGVH